MAHHGAARQESPKVSFLSTYAVALESLLTDPAIIEVAINPDGEVWFEKQGAVHMERASSIEPFSQRKANIFQERRLVFQKSNLLENLF